ncbi:hypothetical protein TUE45_00496 [Streptomyces reticuli]|nr:hypothetical protein TUE45_00496 [Streptomyces reticuli]
MHTTPATRPTTGSPDRTEAEEWRRAHGTGRGGAVRGGGLSESRPLQPPSPHASP